MARMLIIKEKTAIKYLYILLSVILKQIKSKRHLNSISHLNKTTISILDLCEHFKRLQNIIYENSIKISLKLFLVIFQCRLLSRLSQRLPYIWQRRAFSALAQTLLPTLVPVSISGNKYEICKKCIFNYINMRKQIVTRVCAN